MNKNTGLSVNHLPVLTWNHIGINEAQFPETELAEVEFDACYEKSGFGKELAEIFDNIETGMGAEAVAFTMNHCTNPIFIRVKEGEKKVIEPLKYTFADGAKVCDVTYILAEKNSEVSVFQSYISEDDTASYHAGLTKIVALEGAKVTLIQTQLLNDSSLHSNDLGIKIEDSAKVELVQAELGAKMDYVGCMALLSGYCAEFAADTIYYGDEKRKTDLNFIARHTGKKTVSNMKAKGALFGETDKVYRGTIDFINGCKKAKGDESEETLIFSDKARNRTIPLILCDEEDVVGNHAATIGRINENRMFYLMSRGLSENEVKELVVRASYESVLSRITDEEIRSKVDSYLERRMIIE